MHFIYLPKQALAYSTPGNCNTGVKHVYVKSYSNYFSITLEVATISYREY